MLRTRTRASVLGLSVLVAVAVAAVALVGTQSSAEAEPGSDCSVQQIAGSWMFGTDVGQHSLAGQNITALGTMNIDRDGAVTGEFDFTLADTVSAHNSYTGTVAVNPDCTGTLTFVTEDPHSERTDSIVVLNGDEMWGMSQNPAVLWTYDVRRISGQAHQ